MERESCAACQRILLDALSTPSAGTIRVELYKCGRLIVRKSTRLGGRKSRDLNA